jgi:hypothetical protein
MKIYQRIAVKKEPVLIAGWPGMGNVALGAVDYLRETTKAFLFAEIETEHFTPPEAINVRKGLGKLPSPPRNGFYFSPVYNIIFFESEAQLAGLAGQRIIEEILSFAQKIKTKIIFTGAAFPLLADHQRPVEIFGVASSKELFHFFSQYPIKVMQSGQISGLNGLLLGYAGRLNLKAFCLLATIPLYAINLPNPRASRKLVETLSQILKIKVDYTKIDRFVEEMDKKMEMIENKIKNAFPPLESRDLGVKVEEDKVPPHILEKIERLFQEAKLDRNKAYLLKKELDRWNLYEKYEDRFLDLFKEHH